MRRSQRRHVGNVRERRPGVFEVCADAGTDPITGRRLRRYLTVYGTRRDADRALVELTAELRAGRVSPAGGTTFAELLDAWWTTMAAHRWEDATAIRHRQDIRVHLAELGRRRLRDLTPTEFDRLYAAMTAAGLSARTVQHVHGTARAALNHAVRQGLIPRNPAASAVVPVRRRSRRTLPSAEQLAAVLDLAADDDLRWSGWFTVAFRTGARPAEICALRWADIDLDRAEITYREALGRALEGGYRRKGTKTQSEHDDGERTVAVDLGTVAVLRRWRAVLAARVLETGHRMDGRYVVFPSDPLGQRPMNPDAPSKRWRAYARKVGVDDAVRLYDAARHYHVSWCLQQGFAVAEVAERVGNSPEIIFRAYAHVLAGRSRAIADAIDQHAAQ